MGNISKLMVMVGVLGIAGVADAKGGSLDDMFANANAKGSKSSRHERATKAKVSKKVAAQPRVAAASAAPNRAPKAAAPAPAAPSAPAAAAPAANSNTMVLADYAPDRHALAGP